MNSYIVCFITYLNKFTYLNTFKIEVAHRRLDNGGPTVLISYSYIAMPMTLYTVTILTSVPALLKFTGGNSSSDVGWWFSLVKSTVLYR